MDGLRVIPTWRHGQERLYVCLPDGRNIAWYDPEAARVNLLGEDHEDDVLRALGPFVTGPVRVGPPPVPTPAELARLTLHPDDDLAPNRPGEALLVALDRDPGRARRLRPDPAAGPWRPSRPSGTPWTGWTASAGTPCTPSRSPAAAASTTC